MVSVVLARLRWAFIDTLVRPVSMGVAPGAEATAVSWFRRAVTDFLPEPQAPSAQPKTNSRHAPTLVLYKEDRQS